MKLIPVHSLAALFLCACSGAEPLVEPAEPTAPPTPTVDEAYEALKGMLTGGEAVVKCTPPERPDERKLLATRWREVQIQQDTLYAIAPANTGNIFFKAPWKGPWGMLEVFWDARKGEDDIVCVFEDRKFAALVATPASPPEGVHLSAIGCEDLLGVDWPVLKTANKVLRLDTNLNTECAVQALAWKFEEGKDPLFARGRKQLAMPVRGAATPVVLDTPAEGQFKVATEEDMRLFAIRGGEIPSDEGS